jgi:hypothetical protein
VVWRAECVSLCIDSNLECHPCQQHALAASAAATPRPTMHAQRRGQNQHCSVQKGRRKPFLGGELGPALASQPCWELFWVMHPSQPGMTLVQCTLQGTPLHMHAGPLLMAPAQVQPIWLSYSGCATMYDDLVTAWVATTPEWGHAASASVPGSASSGNVPPTCHQ